MTNDQIGSALREYILSSKEGAELGDALTVSYPLIDAGLLDSLAVFNLVIFVEEDFGVVLHDEDLVPENFATIGAIASLVESRQAMTSSQPGTA